MRLAWVPLLCLAPLIASLPLLVEPPKGGVPRPNVENNILLMGDSLVRTPPQSHCCSPPLHSSADPPCLP